MRHCSAFLTRDLLLLLTAALLFSLPLVSCSEDSSPTEPDNYPPVTPNSPHPADGSVYERQYLTVSWESSDPDGDPIAFEVLVMDEGDTLVWTGTTYEMTVETGFYLLRNMEYTWTVRASDGQSETQGPAWTFTTPEWTNEPPDAPADPWPADGETGIRISGPDLTWTASDPDPGDFLTFDVYFGTSEDPALAASGVDQTSYTLPTLDYDTVYYWRIVSIDDRGASTSGPVWSFTTRDQPSTTSENKEG